MTRLLLLLLCCIPFAATAADQPLGRLFLSPAERAALDVVRQNSKPPQKIITPGDAEDEDLAAESEPAVIPPVITLDGYVKRSDGKGTVWVNGRPVQEKIPTRDIEVGRMQGNTNQVQIKLPGNGQTVKLKAGQSYDPATGKMVDSLRDLPPPQPETATTLNKQSKEMGPKAENTNADNKTKPATDEKADLSSLEKSPAKEQAAQ